MTSLRIRSFGLIAFAVAALAGPFSGVAQAAAPANVTEPAVNGTPQVGQSLTYTAGTWNPASTTVDQWWSCTPTCAQIPGTTDNQASYTLQPGDAGATIEISETATDGVAGDTAASTTSPAVGPVTAAPPPASPTNSTRPSITGTDILGQTLTETGDAWSGSPTTFTYQWLRCTTASSCTTITTNGSGKTYTLVAADVGDTMEVQMTASNSNPTPSAVVTSDPTPVVVGTTPTNTTPPSITGTDTVGQLLTESGDAWTGSPTTYTYQWLRCPTATTCTAITDGTGAAKTYTLVAADTGDTMEVQMTASNGNPTPSAVVTSGATPVIVGATPTNSTLPSITGADILGQVLTETGDAWTGTPTTYTYQWLRCTTATSCTAITTNGTAKTYTLVAADVGDTMEVQMTASNSNPTPSAVATSGPSPTVVPPPPSFVAPPSISGTAQSGQTLTEGPAKWGATWPPTSTAVQWYRCDSNNLNCQPVGTGTTYKLTDLDVGATMQVWETASNAGGSSTNYSNFSNAIRNISSVVPVPTVVAGSAPAVAGSAQLGRTLTGSGAQFNSNPGSFSYQWLRCNPLGCSAIPGATGATYTPTSGDVGDSLAFAETASNSGGTSATVQSPRTGTITAPSTTTLQASSGSPAAGQTVTLIATVTSAAGSVKPAGTVVFHDGSTAIAACSGLALGSAAPTAVCQASFPASVANVTAAYSATPGTFITGSTSSPTTLDVGRAATTVTVATASGHATLGAKTTYTATVHTPAGNVLTPTGRITFTDGGKSIKGCGSKALATRKAPCSVKYLDVTQHRISARYSGDANFAPSASITSHVLVRPKAPSGVVSVFMNWTFSFTPHSTRIKSLNASGLAKRMHIAVTCAGGGCPFAHRTLAVPASGKCGKGKTVTSGCLPASSVNLAPIFHGAHLHLGTKVTLAITHANWLGKYYRFTIRPSHLPKILVSCLAVNGTRPGVGCSAQ